MSEAAIHVDQRRSVWIKTSHTEAQILDGLETLRDENIRAEIRFHVQPISWTERICQEMILTFQFHRDLGRHRKTAEFSFRPETMDHVHSVLHSPVTTELFREFYFSGQYTMYNQEADSIAFVLRRGRSVYMCDYELGQDFMSILSEGLVTPDGLVNHSPQDLRLDSFRFMHHEYSMEERSSVQCLADGLERNRTLNSFLSHGSRAADGTAARIVESLIGHPTLTKLEIKDVEFGHRTADAIGRLLASPTCKVSDLALSRHHPATELGFKFDRLLIQLPAVCTSVQSLDLSGFRQLIDQDSANQLLGSLWKLPNLKRLRLKGNSIQDLVQLARNLTMTTPHSRLRELDLHRNDFNFGGQSMSDERSTQAILHLLDVFPELRSLGDDVAEQFPAIVRQRLDLNGCSGMLLRGAEVPLSVWAVVLAKVDTYPFLEPSEKENVIYKMINGPAFAGRGRLD